MHTAFTRTREIKDTCPRCAQTGSLSVYVSTYRDETTRTAGCFLCGADLDPDTLADLGTTDGD